MPGYSTFYPAPGTPYALGGAAGGAAIFDILPHQRFQFDPTHSHLLSELAVKFDKLNPGQKNRIKASLHRLAQAKGRYNAGDVCLDLGIALEMVLLNTEHENQELPGHLNLHFRLRGTWLIGKTSDERRSLYRTLGKIYALRSKIAHNGFSNELDRMPYRERREMLAEHIAVSVRILQHLILSGTPHDWASVILGDSTHLEA